MAIRILGVRLVSPFLLILKYVIFLSFFNFFWYELRFLFTELNDSLNYAFLINLKKKMSRHLFSLIFVEPLKYWTLVKSILNCRIFFFWNWTCDSYRSILPYSRQFSGDLRKIQPTFNVTGFLLSFWGSPIFSSHLKPNFFEILHTGIR